MIDISHHADLLGTFQSVVLVNTQLVDPHIMVVLAICARTEVFQKSMKVFSDAEMLAVQADRVQRCRVAPCVG